MTRKRSQQALAVMLAFLFILTSCVPASPTPVLPNTGTLYTQAAQTVAAQLTLAAGATAVAQLTRGVSTPQAQPSTQQPAPSTDQPAPPTNAPAAPTSTPTQPPPPTPTPTHTQPPPTPTPRPCDWAEFVADVTVKDGTVFKPGTSFTKTWRLKNIGTCNWTTNYDLVFVSGDQMDASKSVPLDERIRPGETVDLSVDLIAPEDPDEYLGHWQLRNADGDLFGIGDDHDKPFWVSIKVVKSTKIVWEMEEDFCLATWSTGVMSELACPDLGENTEIGFINRHPQPALENGRTENEAALVTYPNRSGTEEGFIHGFFPSFRIRNGDEFRAMIGCLYESVDCNVTFQLNYRLEDGRIRNLATWKEKYDKRVHKVAVDLSDLAGENVELILTVLNNGDSLDDYAFWVRPTIWR